QRLEETPGVGRVFPPQLDEGGAVGRIDGLLKGEPFSTGAPDPAAGKGTPPAHAAAPAGTDVLVGGNTSAFADVRTVMDTDMLVIFPVAAGLIGLILILMLRSLV